MRNLTTLVSCLALLGLAGCDDNGGDGGEDTSVDTVEDTVTPDVEEDTTTDAPEDVVEEDGTGACVDDDTHHYITVSGTVTPLATGDTGGLYVAAISPIEALSPGAPTPIVEGTTESDGSFTLECINTYGVNLGLVILVDDDPEDGEGGTFFPTGTGVQAWTDPMTAVDEDAASVMAVTNDLVDTLETATGLDAMGDGFIMGLVIDSSTGDPIEGATVESAGGGSLPVEYPTADFSGLESDGDTSANGSYVITESLALTALTAEASGYTFGEHNAATKGGFCYFQMMTSE
jgi:hypothetical protein